MSLLASLFELGSQLKTTLVVQCRLAGDPSVVVAAAAAVAFEVVEWVLVAAPALAGWQLISLDSIRRQRTD